ncbi:hypothetical protein ACLHZV_22450, partial [Aeromonas salmonicida]|uniref:hypothetical protein n=1 Tax=Aeromonas salmonicida TaxID=645 RepID=UPI003CFF352E
MGSGGSTALWPPGKLLQSEKADVNNDLPVGFAITELGSSSSFATRPETLLGCCMVKPHG